MGASSSAHRHRASLEKQSVATSSVLYKIVVFGQGGTGKSCLVVKLAKNHFVVEYDPTIEDVYRASRVIDGSTCILDLLDTGGQEEYAGMNEQHMSTGEGFALVYTVTNRESFEYCRTLREKMLSRRVDRPSPCVLIGNKSDLEDRRLVPKEEGERLGQELGLPFFETSAKLSTNVEESFAQVVREIHKSREINRPTRGRRTD